MLLYYERPVDVSNLLPPTARAVVFGNGTIAKLLSLSQKVCAAAEGKSASEQLALYRQFLHDSRSYFSDQITSRSLGHVPLQSFLQSNSKARSIALFFIFVLSQNQTQFRKFAFAQVPLVESFLKSKNILTHGHLGSVLYGPVQRLPRVLLLVDRLKNLSPNTPGVQELYDYVRFVLNEFEQNK